MLGTTSALPEKHKTKLDTLRAKLQAGEESPIVVSFNGEVFIAAMHKKYIKGRTPNR